MKTLIILLCFFSPLALAKTIPAHMLHTSMQSIDRRADLIVSVSMEQSLDDSEALIVSDTFNVLTATTPVIETSMRHKAKVVEVFKNSITRLVVSEGDFIIIDQWRDTKSGLSYEGVPVLQQGGEYLLYLYYTHKKSSDGQAIYAVTGVNGGLLNLDAEGNSYREEGSNTSSISLTD